MTYIASSNPNFTEIVKVSKNSIKNPNYKNPQTNLNYFLSPSTKFQTHSLK